MSKELMKFMYGNNEVRTVQVSNETWFVAKDVCSVLEIANHKDAVSRLNAMMKGEVGIADSIGRMQGTLIITEAGVYKLVFTSRKPEAEKFIDWLASEVIPSIRKHGVFATKDLLDNPDLLIEALQELKKERQAKEEAEKKLAHKEEVIIGLVDEISLGEKRQILNRVVRHGGKYQERWRELYKQFEMKYHIDLNRRVENFMLVNNKKITKLEYIDIEMGKLPELYEIACKIYQQDVEYFIDKMFYLNE